jgi:hypothetical protein
LVISERSGGVPCPAKNHRRELVGRQAGVALHFAGGAVIDRDLRLGGDILDLGLVVTQRGEIAVGDVAQRMALRADFLVDLETALQLLLVELAEHAVAGERQMFGVLVELAFDGVRYLEADQAPKQ